MIEGVNTILIEKKYNYNFSICSIITNIDEYNLMRQSFVENGFDERTEYLVADNINGNSFDAYVAINRFLQEGKAEYIVIVHQDVRCIDRAETLINNLKNLQILDPLWCICGNAGAHGYKNSFYYLNDNGRLRKSGSLPAKVSSLDENFLIVKAGANLAASTDINNFHFYGTDLCLVADFLGYNCYVIEFMVDHLSSGNLNVMIQQQALFIKKYSRKLRKRFIQTSCTKFYLGNSETTSNFYNNSFVFFWIKAAHRVINIFKH